MLVRVRVQELILRHCLRPEKTDNLSRTGMLERVDLSTLALACTCKCALGAVSGFIARAYPAPSDAPVVHLAPDYVISAADRQLIADATQLMRNDQDYIWNDVELNQVDANSCLSQPLLSPSACIC